MSNTWSGPGRALQCHLDLFAKVDRAHDWIESNQGHGVTPQQVDAAPEAMRQRFRLMTSMADTLGMQVIVDGKTVATQRDDADSLYSQFTISRGVALINTEWDILNRGETHYISHNVMATVAAAAEQASDEPLFPTDLPCPRGLIVFEYPLLIPDLHPETGEVEPGLEMPVRAIAWGTETVHARKADSNELEALDGMFYALYTDEAAWKSLFVESVKRELPDEYAAYTGVYENPNRDPIWCIDTSGWSFGKSWKRSPDPAPRDSFPQGEIHDTVAKIRRFLLALFRFEWQRILVPQVYRPTRPELKRAHRAGLKLEDGYVKILRLRRHVEAEARGETINESDPFSYDHAWLVRGHPRRQWFPSLGPARNPDGSFNHDSHRLIWIEPHVKGNPFAPLVIGHNVTAVVR